MPTIDPPAFYGKLPAHGDFISRGLSSGQEAAIDRWLASWIQVARDGWAEAFDRNYREAQPWLYGGGRMAAIAIPSADKVGRLFPLLAAVAPGGPVQGLYDTVVTAIAEQWDGDRLLSALEELPAGADAAPSGTGWFVPDAAALSMPHPLEVAGAAEDVLA